MSVEVGTAYVTIVPSAKGFAGKLQSDLGGDLGKAGEAGGKAYGGGMLSSIKSVVAPLAGIFAVTGAVNFLKDSISEARESQKVGALTEQVIKSTGSAAKVTSAQVGDLAMAISNKTGIDDEAIQAAGNLLLTFTNVRNEVGKGNDVFNQATQAATDMGAALGGDPKANAIQLGKALNDPVKGITALTRVGVSFTAQQKEQVAAMVASGNLLGAQKIILGEVNREFGGAAAASATAGEKFKTTYGNLKEAIGTALLPALDAGLSKATEFAAFLTSSLGPTVDRLDPVFRRVSYVAEVFFDAIRGYDDDTGGMGWVDRVQSALLVVNTAFSQMKYAAEVFFDALKGYETDVGGMDWVNTLMLAGLKIYSVFTDTLIPAFQTVVGFVRDNIEPILSGLGITLGGVLVRAGVTLALVLGGSVVAAIGGLFAAIGPVALLIGSLAGAFVNAYQHSATFRDVVAQVGAFVMTQALPALVRLAGWIQSNVIPAVMGIVTAISGFASVALPIVVQFVEGMRARIEPLMPQVRAIFSAIGQIIVGALELIRAVIERATAVIAFIWRTWGQNIMDFIAVVFRAVLGVIQPALALIMSIVRTFITVFHGDWSGAWEGVKSILSNAWAVIKAIIGGALDIIKGALALAWAVILTGVQAVWGRVLDSIRESWGAITQRIGFGIENAKKTLSDAWDSIRRTVGAAWDAVVGLVSDAWERLKTGVGRGSATVKKWLSDAWESIKLAASGAWGGIVSAVGSIWDGIIDKIKSPLQTVLKFIGDNFVKPLNDMLSKVGIDFRIPWPSFADGGPVGPGLVNYGAKPRGYAVGGTVGGYSPHDRADNIPAWLTAGEFILPVAATNALRMQGGDGLLESLRQGVLNGHADGGLVRGYADGGSVWDAIKTGARVGAGLTPVGSAVNAVGDVGSFLADPVGKFKELVARLLSGIGSGVFPEIAKGALTKFGDGLAEKAKSMLAAVTGTSAPTGGGGGGTPYTGAVAAGVEQWRGLSLQMLAKQGQDVGLINTLLRRMNQESGGNPNAINLWDSNAKAGTPSKGLMQVIDPTFAAYRDPSLSSNIYDPSANIASSIRYAMKQYGSLANAYNRPGGYAHGGVVKPILLDSGGVIPRGFSMVENNTGGPEHLTRTDGAAVTNHFNIPSMDPYAVALEVSRRQLMGV